MAARFGFLAALGAFAASVAYGIPQIMQVLGWLPTPLDLILIFAPSLALAPLYVLTMAAVVAAAPDARRVFALGAFGLAVMYAVLVGGVYVVQLGVVIPAGLAGRGPALDAFACCAAGHPMTAIDLLGYTMMSLSTLLAAPVLGNDRLDRAARLFMVANGFLAPFLIGQLAFPGLIAIGALWLITFPGAMLLLALIFRRRI